MNKYYILISLFFALNLSAQKVNWLSIEKAQELQKKVPKNIIMDIYTDWCGPCKLMDKNTFQNPDVAQYLNNNFYACLLYTSPSQRDISTSRMPYSA